MQISPVNFYKYNIINPPPQKASETAFGRIGLDGNRMQKYFAHFPCPCCGLKKMLTYDDIKWLTDMPENTPASIIIPLLAKYQQSMHPVEKEIFCMLKNLAEVHPDYNLRKLLETQRDTHLKSLKAEEMVVLEKLSRAKSLLTPKYANRLQHILSEAKSVIKSGNPAVQFKRKIFIGRVKYSVMNFPEKNIVRTIFKIAEEIPKAGTSVSAFVVKHTQKNPYTGQERTSKGIIHALLSPSLGTIEHIKVRSQNIKGGGGKDEMSNYLLECAKDNNERNSMPFYEFVRLHPEYYGQHLQRYIDKFMRKFSREKIQAFECYPEKVKRTLWEESRGLVSFNIPGLNIPDA